MKQPLAVTNTLLAIIAVCLCLLVLKLYDVELVAEAHAAPGDTLRVHVVNDQLPCTVEGPLDARIHFHDGGSWSPVRGDYRGILVRPQE